MNSVEAWHVLILAPFHIYLTLLSVCLVSPVKLKYILSEGCKLLRLVEGLEE